MREIIITKANAGGRLDKILAKYIDKAPKSFVYKMLRKKNIVLNGKKAAGSEILKEGDSIKLFLADETIAKFQGKHAGLDTESGEPKEIRTDLKMNPDWIVYEDEQIIAFNKPAGLLSQKSKNSDLSLNDYLLSYMNQKTESDMNLNKDSHINPKTGSDQSRTSNLDSNNSIAGQSDNVIFTPGISNRLDRNTSGLVIAGKTLYATRELNEAIKDRRLQKKYYCLVTGQLSEGQTLDGYLIKDEKTNTVKVIDPEETINDSIDIDDGQKGIGVQPKTKSGNKTASRIITKYEPVKVYDDATLLEVDLITGKSHQIRAHLASIGHPIIGDVKYGSKSVNEEYRKTFGIKRQLLHAHSIVFHDMTGDMAYLNGKEITAPLPDDFESVIS